MVTLNAKMVDGGDLSVEQSVVEELKYSLRGVLVSSDHNTAGLAAYRLAKLVLLQ